jgi:hypothetical protein
MNLILTTSLLSAMCSELCLCGWGKKWDGVQPPTQGCGDASCVHGQTIFMRSENSVTGLPNYVTGFAANGAVRPGVYGHAEDGHGRGGGRCTAA